MSARTLTVSSELSSFFNFFKAVPLAFRGESVAARFPWVLKLASENMGAATRANASSFNITHTRGIVGAYVGRSQVWAPLKDKYALKNIELAVAQLVASW